MKWYFRPILLLGFMASSAAARAQGVQVPSSTLPTTSMPATTLSTTSITIVPAPAGARMRATLWNYGSSNAWCNEAGGAASIGAGVPLPANGGGFNWSYPSAGFLTINCICATANGCTISGSYQQ